LKAVRRRLEKVVGVLRHSLQKDEDDTGLTTTSAVVESTLTAGFIGGEMVN
jgi:hypothetical protein